MEATIRTRRRWLRLGLIVLVPAASVLFLCELGARLLTTTHRETGLPMMGRYVLVPYRPSPETVRASLDWPGSYVVRDSELGWTVRPRGRTPDGLYQASAEGARAPTDRSYGERPPPGRLRVVTVGDSFTHGDSVGFDDTWQRHLERRDPGLEVVNLGVPAYGTDQAYLRWRRDGARLHPRLAILGIWPEDICRNLNVVRFFFQPIGAFGFVSKPRFVVAQGRLATLNTPVLDGEPLVRALTDPASAALLRHDYWAIPGDLEPRPWQRLRVARAAATVANLYHRRALRERLYTGADASGIELTAAIAEAFHHHAVAAGAIPVVVVIPMLDLLARYPGEDDWPFVRALRARGVDAIDLGPPMARVVREEGSSCCYAADRHLSPEGNRRLAGWLLERLGPRLDEARAQLEAEGRSVPPS